MLIEKVVKTSLSVVIFAGTDILVSSMIKKSIPDTANAVVKAVTGITGIFASAMIADQVCSYANKSVDEISNTISTVEELTKKKEAVVNGEVAIES